MDCVWKAIELFSTDIVLAASQSWQSHWESWIHVQVGMGQTPNLTLLFTPYLAALDVHSPIPMVLYALTHPEACLFSLVPAAYQGNVWKSFFQDLRTWEKEDTERISWFMSVSFFCGAIATVTRCPWFVLWQPRGCWLPRHHWLAALLQHAQNQNQQQQLSTLTFWVKKCPVQTLQTQWLNMTQQSQVL